MSQFAFSTVKEVTLQRDTMLNVQQFAKNKKAKKIGAAKSRQHFTSNGI